MAFTDFLDIIWFGNTWLQFIEFFALLLAGVIVGKIFHWVSKGVVRQFANKTKTRLDDLLVDSLEKPITFLLVSLGFYFGGSFLTFSESGALTFSNIFKILLTIDVAWFIMNVIDALIVNYIQPASAKTKNDLDDTLIPIIRKALRVIIISVTIVMIIDNFGYDVTSVVAGLGIGGLAFALAAQDLLSNLFGGVAILTDKPFRLGDRIRLDSTRDGWIREIGIRTTRMETLDGTMLVIPNKIISNNILENVSKEKARKVKFTIGLVYDTSDAKLKKAKNIIKDIIKKNKDTKDNSLISFVNFGDSALEFLIIYWIKNFDNILGAKDKINSEIKKQFEKENIEMAYPTQTVYIKK